MLIIHLRSPMFVPHVSPYSQIDDGFPVRQGMGLPRDGVFDERELLADQQAHQNSGGIPLQHPQGGVVEGFEI